MNRAQTGLLAVTIVLILLRMPVIASAQTADATFKVICFADPNAQQITGRKACQPPAEQITFGNTITLAVEHAPEVTFDDVHEPDPTKLVLFLDGRPVPGSWAYVRQSETDEQDVTTTLLTYTLILDLNTDEARKNWKEIVSAANSGRKLQVSTGLLNGAPARSTAEPIRFVLFRTGRLIWWAIAAVAGLIIFFVIAAYTGALRDKEPDVIPGEPDPQPLKPTERAFSLSRSQMALWTMLTIYAYLFIWFLTGAYSATIPASIVGLMGISLGTLGLSAAIDKTKSKESEKKADEATDAEKKAQLLTRAKVCQTEGFFRDITTSADGASLHRLQFIVWTVALAVVFCANVWRTLSMPDFDSTMLALMGITSGAYVGLKLPEDKC